MARTVKQWRREVETIFAGEGVTKVTFTPTKGVHMKASGRLGGREVWMVVSVSPSDHRAGHRVRQHLRKIIKEQPTHAVHR